MEFFPLRRDRAAADTKMDELRALIGRTARLRREIAATGECIGFVGIQLPMIPRCRPNNRDQLAARAGLGRHVFEAAEAASCGYYLLGLKRSFPSPRKTTARPPS